MSEYKAVLVWIDQGMGHGHVALKTFEDKAVLNKMPIKCPAELIAIHNEINDYLSQRDEDHLEEAIKRTKYVFEDEKYTVDEIIGYLRAELYSLKKGN